MKRRDIITIVIAIVIFIITAGVIYRYFVPPPKNSGITVEIPRPVVTDFSQDQLQTLHSLTDFTQDINPNFPDKPRIFN